MELAGTLAEVARQTPRRGFPPLDTSQLASSWSRRQIACWARSTVSSRRRPGRNSSGSASRFGLAPRSPEITAEGVKSVPTGSPRGPCSGRRAWPHRPWRSLKIPLDRAGRVPVEPDLTISGHPNVYVIGAWPDLEEDGKPVPGIAPAAMQEGRHAAANILRTLRGQPRLPFHYVDKAHWPRSAACCRRPHRVHPRFGIPRLVTLVVRSYFLLDRFPQPPARDDPVGLVVLHLRPWRPPDHRAAHTTAGVGRGRIEKMSQTATQVVACRYPLRRASLARPHPARERLRR